MKNITVYCLLLTAYCLLASCTKEEGVGGTSTITGKVYVKEYSQAGNLLAEYYGDQERVFIIYGNGTAYDNDYRTSYDGSYIFEFLNKGTYQVFCYSNCDTCASGNIAVIKEVEITDNNSTLEVEDIVIRK